MENQTPRIAVAIRYKKAFREWLKSLPWVNNIPAHMLNSSGRVIIVGLPVDMFGDEDWFELKQIYELWGAGSLARGS